MPTLTKTVKARQQHCCNWCSEAIPAKTDYARSTCIGDGTATTVKMHVECKEAWTWANACCHWLHSDDDFCPTCNYADRQVRGMVSADDGVRLTPGQAVAWERALHSWHYNGGPQPEARDCV